MQGAKKRFDGLDILKCIGAFFIIVIHIPFPGEVGGYIDALARFAVPVFLMITGYFYTGVVQRNRTGVQLKKVLFLVLGANLLYLAYECGTALVRHTLSQTVKQFFTLSSLRDFLLFNQSPFHSHLWYLNALLYVLVIVELLRRFVPRWKEVLWCSAPVLLIALEVLLLLFGESQPLWMFRNFFFIGIPYFAIGLFLYHHQDFLAKCHSRRLLVGLAVILSLAAVMLERYLVAKAQPGFVREHYLATTFFAAGLFILFSDPRWNEVGLKLIKTVGRKYSMMVYIIHPIFKVLFIGAMSRLHLQSVSPYVSQAAVFIISIVFSVVSYAVKGIVLLRFGKSGKGA